MIYKEYTFEYFLDMIFEFSLQSSISITEKDDGLIALLVVVHPVVFPFDPSITVSVTNSAFPSIKERISETSTRQVHDYFKSCSRYTSIK